jgi:Amt family ammonium transporter
LHEAAASRVQLEADLRRALERNELRVHYQPILSLATRQLQGLEALVQCPRVDDDGNITISSPTEFIPVAEDSGLIVPLGDWILLEACEKLAIWNQKYAAAVELTVAINVSGKQLIDDSFVETSS